MLLEGEGCGIIVVILIIYYFIVYVLKWIVVAAIYVIYFIAGIGVIIGTFYALKSFFKSLFNVFGSRFSGTGEGRFKSETAKKEYFHVLDKKDMSYEEYSRKMYFMGPCTEDVCDVIGSSFGEMYLKAATGPDFTWYNWPYVIARAISIYVVGTVITLILSVLLFGVFLAVSVVFLLVTAIAYLFNVITIKNKEVSYACDICKEQYAMPVYICPRCGIRHYKLRPNSFGVTSRTCVCGLKLPVVVGGEKNNKIINGDGTISYEKIRFGDLKQECPYCRNISTQGVSRLISIALIGGASAGKTTFKVAFLHDFLDEEIPSGKCNVEVAFPEQKFETEYDEYCKQYMGHPIRATQRGSDQDIFAYSFSLKSNKFAADRMIKLYDMPGEAFESGDVKEGWNIYKFSEGAVLLIDPYILPKVQEENKAEISGSTMGNSRMDLNTLITVFTETLGTVRMKKNGNRFSIPIALVINKADTSRLKKQIGEEAVNQLMATGYFPDKYTAMDYACRCFMIENGCGNFVRNIDSYFENVHFFSCSPMGSVPRGVYARFNPYNVMQIMEWLMIRADKELTKAWIPDNGVSDVPEGYKDLCWTNNEIYEAEVMRRLPPLENA